MKNETKKICTGCNIEKDIDQFEWVIKNKRRRTKCRACRELQRKIRYNKNSVEINKKRAIKRIPIAAKLNEKARNNPKRKERQYVWDTNNLQTKMWHAAKRRAAKKNIPFTISKKI